MKLWNHDDTGGLGPLVATFSTAALFGIIAVLVLLSSACTRVEGHDDNGNPYSMTEFMTNRNIIKNRDISTGRATLNPFAGMFGGTAVPIQDAEGNIIGTTKASRLREVTAYEVINPNTPTVQIGGDVGYKAWGTQDQTSALKEMWNGWTNIVMIKWMGRVWLGLIGQSGDVAIRAIDANR